MSFRWTIALILFCGALGGYVYYTEIRGQKERQEVESKKDRLFDFKEEDVEKVGVLTLEGETQAVVFERTGADGKEWKITAPIATEAEKSATDGFVSSLLYLTSQRMVEENASDLAAYGLKEPRFHISVWIKGQKDPLTLKIGDKSTIGNSFYGLRGTKVHILDTSFENSMRKNLFDFREKKIFPIEDDKVKKVELRREKDTVVVEKTGPDTWRLIQPLVAEGSKSAVEDLLRELAGVQATKFAQEEMTDPAPFGFDKPQVVARVEFEGTAAPVELVIGAKGTHETDLFARSSMKKSVVLVPESIFKTLTKDASELREKNALRFDQWEVQKLSLVYPDRTITCVKSGDYDWKIEAPEKADAEGSEVDDVLYSLDALEATEFIDAPQADLSKYGLDKPRVTVRIWQKGEETAREVMIGSEDAAKGLVHVRNPKMSTIFMVETAKTEELFPKIEDLKKKPEPKEGQ